MAMAMATQTKAYTMEEASKHNSKEDCWVVIHGKVYDVTKYLDEHPGGDDVLLTATGRDSTEDFEDAGHSKTARELMQDYCIGEIESSPVIPELEIVRRDWPSGFTPEFMNKALQHWAIPAGIIGISVGVTLLYMRKK